MAKGALFAMRAPFAAALTHVDTIDPSARRELERLVREHVALEARTEPIPLEDYVAPTADAFGAAFALAATASHKAAFSAMGENVGGALCAFDCALDWDRDRACGAFNPLPDKHAVGVAFSFARESLMAARRTCVGIVGEDSLSARTLDGVLRRIDRRIVRRGSFGDAFFAPIGSHIESSPAAETRDKLWFCCQMVAGTLIDAINRPSAPSVDVCGTNPPAA